MNWLYALTIPIILIGLGATAFNLSMEQQVYSVEEAVNNYQELKGQSIFLKGEIVQGRRICTQIYCGPENPCCNTCSASVKLRNGTSIALTGEKLGCSGNSCSLNCTPSTGEIYRIKGKMLENNGVKTFQVSSYTEVNTP